MRRTVCLFVLLAACSAPPKIEPGEAPAAAAPNVATAAPARAMPRWTQPSALSATPAAVPMPALPPPQKSAVAAGGNDGRDQSGDLSRNAAVFARLPEVGQRASFSFQAEAGEQSLFELSAAGYSRASKGRVRISIEDSSGKVAWQSERDVQVSWRDFTAFTPEKTGTWTYSLTMLESGYRFVLVRHSSYPTLAVQALDLGTQTLLHGHLPNSDSVAKFFVPVNAGEEIAVKLSGTREEAREEARRGATDMGAMVARMDVERSAGRMGGGAKLLFQRFDFQAFADGVALTPLGSYSRVKAVRDGVIELRVQARYAAGGGGLFDLGIERPLSLVHLRGVVVDSEDQPLADVELSFLREPDADPVGFARTNGAGEYDATVLTGNLAIQMLRGQIAAVESVHVRVSNDTQVDLMFQPGTRVRGG